ncbi:MAG: c-type cytochrome domain-containing protein [Pirellulaceae bacterium]
MNELLSRKTIQSLTVTGLFLLIGADSTAADDDAFFRESVEPILRQRCYECHSHGAGAMEGDLTLDWRSGWQSGGGRGSAIKPGDPDGSLLIRAIRHEEPDLKMPDEKLPEAEIEILSRWVRSGAHDPRTAQPHVADDANDWWSLRPLERPRFRTSTRTEQWVQERTQSMRSSMRGSSKRAFVLPPKPTDVP